MLVLVPRRALAALVNLLPLVLRRQGVGWGPARRTLLPSLTVALLRARGANPPLATAERVASALGVRVEDLWTVAPARRRR
jgi:hypothetical protein